MDVEGAHAEAKETFEKFAVGLDMDKSSLERDCDTLQVPQNLSFPRYRLIENQDECLREESRYHYLNNLLFMNKMKLERAEKEKRFRQGDGRMLRDFATWKDLYAVRLVTAYRILCLRSV